MKRWALIPAAGVGTRMGGPVPKQYLPLLGRPVIEHTVRRFLDHACIDGVFVVVRPDDERWPGCGLEALLSGVAHLHEGRERSDSVRAGLSCIRAAADPGDWVLVHDAVRPCVQPGDISRLIETVSDDEVGGLLGIPVRDTIKRTGPEQAGSDDSGGRGIDAGARIRGANLNARIRATVPRDDLWHAQTPQMFRLGLLHDALERAAASGEAITDDSSAVERLGMQPLMVEGRSDNIKITLPGDLVFAEHVLSAEPGLSGFSDRSDDKHEARKGSR